MSEAFLEDRGIVEVEGEDARALLQRLITNDVEALKPGEGSLCRTAHAPGQGQRRFPGRRSVERRGRPFSVGLPAPTRCGSRIKP